MHNELATIRQRLKVKRSHIAEAIGVDYSTVYRWERYHDPMQLETLLDLAGYLEVRPTDIFPWLKEIPRDRPRPGLSPRDATPCQLQEVTP